MHKAKRLTMVALAVEIAFASAYAQDDGTLLERGEAAFPIGQASPRSALTLDTASLTNAWKDSGISVYRCAVLFQNFGKTVMEANGNAAAKRAQLDAATWKLLETGMAKAQVDGNLNLHLAYRAAFDSGLETLKGDNAEIVKIRTARAKRLAQIDADLMAAGVTAAHTLHASLEYQKAEMTKKGDIETAVRVGSFQQKVAEWGKNPQTQGQATAIATANDGRSAVAPCPQPRPQSRPAASETKQIEPRIVTIDARNPFGTSIGKVNAGDTIEIQYVGGKWTSGIVSDNRLAENPDETSHRNKSCLLIVQNDPTYVLAKLPKHTRDNPFIYHVNDEIDAVELALRISDRDPRRPQDFAHNAGSVKYSVKILPSNAMSSTQPVQSGMRRPVAQPSQRMTPSPPPSPSGRVTNHTLTGTQMEESITLAKTAQPHVIKEQYVVPQGKELIVEAGATIIFERGASLYCEGTLRMNGSEQAPIVCKGKMQTIGYWSGIRLRSEDAVLDWVQISGAVQAIQLNKNPSILNCAIFKNEKCGIHIGMDCAGGDARIVNCVIADNGEKGIDCHHGRASFEKCTITRNGKYGMWVGYSGHVKMNDCKIEGNKGDGFCFDAGGQGDVHDSYITGNKGFDIKYTGGGASNFQECYFGKSITRMLQQRGDGANLPNIMDGRDSGTGNFADVADFLTEPPKECGSTLKW